jgi:hypothetical protein
MTSLNRMSEYVFPLVSRLTSFRSLSFPLSLYPLTVAPPARSGRIRRVHASKATPTPPYTASISAAVTESQKQIATLRLRLSPLIAAESTLADRLSGGVRVSGSGKGNAYVRHGWQLRSVGRNLSYRASGSSPSPVVDGGSNLDVSEVRVIEEVGRILDNSKEDVKALWRSDVVQKMTMRPFFSLSHPPFLATLQHSATTTMANVRWSTVD